MGQYTRLIVDGAEVTFKHITLERLGTRVIELVNGAQLHVGALGRQHGRQHRLSHRRRLRADLRRQPVGPGGRGQHHLRFRQPGQRLVEVLPFINPEWLDCPNVTGYSEGDLLEIAGQGSAQRFQVRDGRIVANRPR